MMEEFFSRQPNIDSVVWLLLIIMQVYNEKSKWAKNEYKMYSFKRKRAPENLLLEPRLVLKEIKILA